MYAYESLALGMTAVVLYAATRRARSAGESHVAFTTVILLGIGAVVTTHHVTTHVLAAYFALWTTTFLFFGLGKREKQNPAWTMILIVVVAFTWILNVSNITIEYVAPIVANALGDFANIFLRGTGARQLFVGETGQAAPLWEQLIGYLAALLIVLGIPPGVLLVWRRYRTQEILLALAVGALAYPMTQALRFTESGIEIAGRISPFLYVPLSFILAFGSRVLWPSRLGDVKRLIIMAVAMTIIFLGGAVVSLPHWGRLPGPYLASAGPRSVDRLGIEAAVWLRDSVGPNNRVAADRTNTLIMLTHGRQRTVTSSYDGVDVPTIFLAPVVDEGVLSELRAGRIDYIVVDYRFSDELPMLGSYYDPSELRNYDHDNPVALTTLAKFDSYEHASRVFDSGDIAIYDVRALSDEP
jgi:hypothetical protein